MRSFVRNFIDINIHLVNYYFIKKKDVHNLYELFHVREYLTRRAYKHETGAAINYMVVEALYKANS